MTDPILLSTQMRKLLEVLEGIRSELENMNDTLRGEK